MAVARPLTNNHPVNPVKKLLAFLVVTLAVTSSVRVWAQAAQESAAVDATVTAPVVVDGQVLFQVRGVSSLPAADRAKVQKNLEDLRHAADEISATLKQHPSDPLLQDLLMSTYQSELQLLANVSDLPTAGSMRTDL